MPLSPLLVSAMIGLTGGRPLREFGGLLFNILLPSMASAWHANLCRSPSKALTMIPPMMENDRRSFQRLKLGKPILATLDGHSALILDIGITGAFIEHRGRAMPGLKFRLSFRWQATDITFDSEVVRSTVVREGGEEGVMSQSAVEFSGGQGDSEERLQQMMATFVGQLLAAQRANASAEVGSGVSILDQLGHARRTRSSGLVAYQWDGISWTRTATKDSEQPLDGFTVAAYEDEEELATLCDAYEAADEEGRRLIRLVAELSVRSAGK